MVIVRLVILVLVHIIVLARVMSLARVMVLARVRDALPEKNGIMWEKFPSGGPPSPNPQVCERPVIQNKVGFIFYRTQVNLGSDLWVRMSVRHKLHYVCKT